MRSDQRALRFSCEDACLVAVIDMPERALTRGVLIVTGGPQYRAGSHRQHTLLSRMLAARGIPVMRFDHRGCGDGEGAPRSFDRIDTDIGMAMKEFFIQAPGLKEAVIWALCDGASAAALYAFNDERVAGLILLNPWTRAPAAPCALLRAPAPVQFGELAFWMRMERPHWPPGSDDRASAMRIIREQMRASAADRAAPLPQRLLASLGCFEGRLLVILSGADPVGREFADLLTRHRFPYQRLDVEGANYSFASRKWRDEVAYASANWLSSW